MTTHTARSVLDGFYRAESEYTAGRQDFSHIAAILSLDFVMPQTSALPWAGTYRGPTGMEEWMKKIAYWFDKLEVQDAEIFESGSDRIMTSSTVVWRVRSTGEEISAPFAQAITVDLERGQIKEIRPFYWDVADLNRRLGYQSERSNFS